MAPQNPLRPYFDIAILGRSITTLLMGTLLAKSGKRVLLVSNPETTPEPDLSLCPVCSNLLQQLNLSLPNPEPAALQVIHEDIRLDLKGGSLSDDEWQRELPGEAEEILSLLAQWDDWGKQLMALIQQVGPPRRGFRRSMAFRWALMQNLPYRELRKPIDKVLQEALPEAAASVVQQMMEGLTCAPGSNVSLAEGSLALYSFVRFDRLPSRSLLDELDKRFEQFHGQTLILDGTTSFQKENGAWKLLRQDGSPIRLESLFLGEQALYPRLKGSDVRLPPPPILCLPVDTDGMAISPVLGTNISLNTPEPATLVEIQSKGNSPYLRLSCRKGTNTRDKVQQTLSRLFPFGAPKLQEWTLPEPNRGKIRMFNAVRRRLPLDQGLFLVDPWALFPNLPGLNPALTCESLLEIVHSNK